MGRSSERNVEKERQKANGQRMHVGCGENGDVRRDAEARKEVGEQERRDKKDGSEGKTEVNTVDEGMIAIVAATGAEGLGNESV